MSLKLEEYLIDEFGDMDPGVWVELTVQFKINEDGSVDVDNLDARNVEDQA